MISVALFGGMALVAGVVLVASGIRARPVPPARQHANRVRRFEPPPPERVGIALATGLLVLLFTRWPVAAVGAAVAVVVALSGADRRRTRVSGADMAEALATWAEMLRDATGMPRGIEGVLVATAPNVPELIRPHITALAKRLPYEPLEDALDKLARDLDHPMGDMVVTALRLSASAGGRQIRGVLDDLALVAREEARMHTRVTVARARPRAQMRLVCVMIAAFVGIMVLFGRGFLEPYGTVSGQMVLVLIGVLWTLAIWTMGRLGQESRPVRFLARGAHS